VVWDPLLIRWVLDEIGFGESVRLCLLLDKNLRLLLDNNIRLWWDYVFCWTLASMDMFYLIGILGSSTFNFLIVNRMLII
jgi:hypothetical protein